MSGNIQFSDEVREGRNVTLTLRGVITSLNRFRTLMRVKIDATNDEMVFTAEDPVGISFPEDSEKSEVTPVAVTRGLTPGLYASAMGDIWEYDPEENPKNPWHPWSNSGRKSLAYTSSCGFVVRPLTRVFLGAVVDERPGYEQGQVYRREGDGALYIRTPNGWNWIAANGSITHANLPEDTRMEKVS